MLIYKWSGITAQGKKIYGQEAAINPTELRARLINKNIFPLKIKVDIKSVLNRFTKINAKDIHQIINKLSVLITANIPIVKAFSIINEEELKPKLKELIIGFKNSLLEGQSLYQTWQNYPKYFNQLICNMINIGEQTGKLDIILIELCVYLKKAEKQNRKIIKTLIYPASILVVAIITTLIILVLVIPQFEIMFNNLGAKLPYYTELIINLSRFLQASWGYFLALVTATVIGLKISYNYSEKIKMFLDKVILNLPLLKTIFTYIYLYRFTKTLSLTLKAGIPLLLALKICKTTLTNRLYLQAIEETSKLIVNGKAFHSALMEQQIFPSRMIQLIAIGEETGELELMLEKISTIYSEELNNLSDTLNGLLEPTIMVTLGIVVGGLVIGMYLPIFRLGTYI